MAKQNINVGTTANDKKGDSLRAAFQKVNANFTELYEAVGLATTGQDTALTFLGSTISTDDSSSIVIDQAVTVSSNLSVGGDIVPQTANGGDLGSSALPWRSLYVSNNTIYIGGTAVGVDAAGNLTTGGTVVGSTPAWANITGKPTIPTGFDRLTSSGDEVILIGGANPFTLFPAITGGDQLQIQGSEVSTVSGSLALTSQDNLNIIANGSGAAPGGSKNWTFSADGSLTIPGDIRSDSNINIEINLADSTLRRWQFGEDGILTLPGGKVSILASTSYGSIQGSANTPIIVYSGGSTGQASLQWTNANPENNVAATAFSGVIVGSGADGAGDVKIITGAYNPMNGDFDKEWTFKANGSLTFPDTTVQTTAWTGTVSQLRSEGNIDIDINLSDSTLRRWSFGEDGNLTLPAGGTILDSSGLPYVNGVSSINTSVSTSIFTDASGDYQYGTLSYDYAVNGVSNSFSIEYSRPLVGGNVDIHVGNTIVNGDLTLSGDIKSNGNINIDINLADSTLRRWQFGEDGNLETPGGIQVAGILKIDNGVHEKFQTKADATGIVTHDCSLGHIFYHTSPDALFTVNFTNLNLSSGYATALTLIIEQGGTGFIPNSVGIGGVIQTLNWQGNATPTPSTNRTDVVTFSIINNSGTYIVLGQLTGF